MTLLEFYGVLYSLYVLLFGIREAAKRHRHNTALIREVDKIILERGLTRNPNPANTKQV